MMTWITDRKLLEEGKTYLVCPLNTYNKEDLHLGRPIGFRKGWEVKRLLPKCYAAIELPPFQTLKPQEKENN